MNNLSKELKDLIYSYDSTYYNIYNDVLKHLKRIYDCCEYNDNADTTLFSKGDYYIDDYYYKIISRDYIFNNDNSD
jgi:hypothetical protein